MSNKNLDDNCLVKHALFLIKELSVCLKLLSNDKLNEIREKMRNLSQCIRRN